MIILVDGKIAALKEDCNIEYRAENRLFMGRDEYTLNISFPLAGCAQNKEIFGDIDRIEIEKSKVFYSAEIRTKELCLIGSVLLTGANESEVTGQFVKGRCQQVATDPFEETMINDLDLGEPPASGSYTPVQAWQNIDDGANEVALPWVNSAYPEQFNNWIKYSDGYLWASTPNRGEADDSPCASLPGSSLSWQPYLIVIAKRICEAVGYSYDFGEWEQSYYRFLLVCNTFPWGRDAGYKDVLPSWSVSEFFEKLELLLLGEFDIDHAGKSVVFRFTSNILNEIPVCELETVVDSYDTDIANDDSECEYLGIKRLEYKRTNHPLSNYYACDWIFKEAKVYEYDTTEEILSKCAKRTGVSGVYPWVKYGEDITVPNDRGRLKLTNADGVFYSVEDDMYFVLRSMGQYYLYTDRFGYKNYAQECVLQPVNVFGSGRDDSDGSNTETLEFVPVCVTDTYVSPSDDMGFMMNLTFSTIENEAYDDDVVRNEDKDCRNKIVQYQAAAIIEAGEKESKGAAYDVIFVGFWDGVIPEPDKAPYPIVDLVTITQSWGCVRNDYACLRLSGPDSRLRLDLPRINPKHKYKFSFISDSIPNPRGIFNIRGRLYVCERITATLSDNGMSQLIKGEFYPVLQSDPS